MLRYVSPHKEQPTSALTKSVPTFESSERYHSWWRRITETYSACGLSVPADKLPAISGIASAFLPPVTDIYIAGLWQNDLPRRLLWHRRDCSGGGNEALCDPKQTSPALPSAVVVLGGAGFPDSPCFRIRRKPLNRFLARNNPSSLCRNLRPRSFRTHSERSIASVRQVEEGRHRSFRREWMALLDLFAAIRYARRGRGSGLLPR
jgi:hypothetical protein